MHSDAVLFLSYIQGLTIPHFMCLCVGNKYPSSSSLFVGTNAPIMPLLAHDSTDPNHDSLKLEIKLPESEVPKGDHEQRVSLDSCILSSI